MDDYNEIVGQSIDNAISFFLKRINEISENGPYRQSRKIPTTFPMLKLGNDEFYEYAYFERTLEWFVRDLLINTILHDLFTIHGIESMWPDNKNYVRYSTEIIEDIFPFEFIININGKKIGVRYTGLCAGEATELIEKYEIGKILQIKWDDKLNDREAHQKECEVVTPAEFFENYLSTVEYELFLSKVIPAIEAANSEIGFETIPRLSLRYLSNFKADVNVFLGNAAFDQMRFQILPGSKEKKPLASMTLPSDDYEIMNRNFQKRGLYKALLGTEGFAKCFITAEYQFQVFKQGHSFDYTSVVCGYLKAIEQLLYKLLLINLDFPSQDKLWIKKNNSNIPKYKYVQDVTVRKNPITKKPQVVFEGDFKDYFDITLAPMIWFLHDNVNGWEISDAGRLVIHSFLLNFAADCRNDHFHKDNIDDFCVVSRIRNNAILITYLLLGGYKLTGSHQKDIVALGIDDDSFDRMYKKIRELPRGISKFVVYFEGQKPIKAYRHFTQEPTIYDDNGSVATSRIRFVAVNEFCSDEYDHAMQGEYREREFTLRKDNIPAKISYINGRQEEIFIVW